MILEKHYNTGGGTHSWEDKGQGFTNQFKCDRYLGPCIPDKGYEWDTGIHYVGNSINADSGSSTGKVLEFLTDGKLKWESMGNLIDVIKLKEKVLRQLCW